MENEAIIRKLRALLAKAEGTIGPESDAFMEKVRELLVKHQLEMHQIQGETDPLEQHEHGILVREEWEIMVCHFGAEYFGCAAVMQRFDNGTTGAVLFGRHSACVTANHMLRFWLNQVLDIAGQLWINPEHVGVGLVVRLQKLIEEKGAAPSNGTDLIPINTALAFAEQITGPTEQEMLEMKGSQLGLAAAERVSLHLQAEDETVDLRRLK